MSHLLWQNSLKGVCSFLLLLFWLNTINIVHHAIRVQMGHLLNTTGVFLRFQQERKYLIWGSARTSRRQRHISILAPPTILSSSFFTRFQQIKTPSAWTDENSNSPFRSALPPQFYGSCSLPRIQRGQLHSSDWTPFTWRDLPPCMAVQEVRLTSLKRNVKQYH